MFLYDSFLDREGPTVGIINIKAPPLCQKSLPPVSGGGRGAEEKKKKNGLTNFHTF